MNRVNLNLLMEEQLAEQASRHDPVRVAISVGALILVLTTGVGVVSTWRLTGVEKEVTQLQGKVNNLQTQDSKQGPADLRAWKGLADDVVAVNRSRALVAPQLALIKDLVPPLIRLSRLTMMVDSQSRAPAPAATAGRRAPARVAAEGVVVRLEGRAECERPELAVQDFIKTLRDHPYLKAHSVTVDLRKIYRESGAGGQPGPAAAPSALFDIECRFLGGE